MKIPNLFKTTFEYIIFVIIICCLVAFILKERYSSKDIIISIMFVGVLLFIIKLIGKNMYNFEKLENADSESSEEINKTETEIPPKTAETTEIPPGTQVETPETQPETPETAKITTPQTTNEIIVNQEPTIPINTNTNGLAPVSNPLPTTSVGPTSLRAPAPISVKIPNSIPTTDIISPYITNNPKNTSSMENNINSQLINKQTDDINDTEKTINGNPLNSEKNPFYYSNDKIVTDETIYSQYGGYIDANKIYVPPGYKTKIEDIGYSYLPPSQWFPIPNPPPVCVVAGQRCKVSPSLTTGYPVNLKEWHSSRRITQPDNINVQYIEDVLNSGY